MSGARTKRGAALLVTIQLCAALWACASPPTASATWPGLKLSPAALERSMAVRQRLTVTAAGRTQQFEVALEAEPDAVRMALLDLGQVVARLEWDGRELRQWSARGWPPTVGAERILSDLQLVYWPEDAVRAALPPGWTLQAHGRSRTLFMSGAPVARVQYTGERTAELENMAQGYRIHIESHESGAR